MRVNHGGFQILVAQKILNRSNIIPVPYQVGREGMAEGMAGGRAAYLGIPDGLLDGSLDDRLVQVMTPLDFRTRVAAKAVGRESPLPAPFPAGRRILPLESIRHVNAGNPFRQVLLVELLYSREPGSELGPQRDRKRNEAILVALRYRTFGRRIRREAISPSVLKVELTERAFGNI